MDTVVAGMLFKNFWKKKKLPVLLMHTDIVYDKKFLDNILKSKKKKYNWNSY